MIGSVPLTSPADRVQRTLNDLVAVPSEGGSADEVRIQHLLAERLGDLGLTVDLWPLDLAALRADAGYPGEEVDRTAAWGLVATNRPGEDVGLVLSGHVDVVPPGDLTAWSGAPYEPVVSAGRLPSTITSQLSTPTTPTSSGTRLPASRSASRQPRAIWSLPQKMPSNGVPAAIKRPIASWPQASLQVPDR